MNVMVVGGGGREHAIIKALKKNPAITTLYALPGNGGIAADATCVEIGAKDLDGIVAFATSHAIDLPLWRRTIPWCWVLSTGWKRLELPASDREKMRPFWREAKFSPKI